MIIIPLLNGYNWEYTLFSDKPISNNLPSEVWQVLVDLASIFFGKATKNMFADMNNTTQQNLGCIEANDIWLNLYPFHVFKQTQGLLPLGFATGQQCVEGDVTWLYLRVLAALVPGIFELEALQIPNLHPLPMPKRQFSRIFPPFTPSAFATTMSSKTAIACCQFCWHAVMTELKLMTSGWRCRAHIDPKKPDGHTGPRGLQVHWISFVQVRTKGTNISTDFGANHVKPSLYMPHACH